MSTPNCNGAINDQEYYFKDLAVLSAILSNGMNYGAIISSTICCLLLLSVLYYVYSSTKKDCTSTQIDNGCEPNSGFGGMSIVIIILILCSCSSVCKSLYTIFKNKKEMDQVTSEGRPCYSVKLSKTITI